jgi:hypothetical protein
MTAGIRPADAALDPSSSFSPALELRQLFASPAKLPGSRAPFFVADLLLLIPPQKFTPLDRIFTVTVRRLRITPA